MFFLKDSTSCNLIFIPYAELHKDRNINLGLEGGSLASKLRLDPIKDRDFSPLPGPLLRKYIAYARQFVAPR